MERNSLLESKGWLGRGGRSKRKWFAHYSLVSFFSSYNVWFCLFAFNVFITYRLSCGTIKTEFYFQPGGGGGGGVSLAWIRSVADKHRLKRNSPFILVALIFLQRKSPGKAESSLM